MGICFALEAGFLICYAFGACLSVLWLGLFCTAEVGQEVININVGEFFFKGL